MDILRFGPGHRRSEGPPGTQGVSGQVILHDDRAVVTELAFGRYAIMTPHSNATNDTLFIVIAGAGFIQVGDERARVNHGEAVMWPAGELHGAYTDGTEMRAIVVELMGEESSRTIASTSGAHEVADSDEASQSASPARARGALADHPPGRDEYDSAEGEPW